MSTPPAAPLRRSPRRAPTRGAPGRPRARRPALLAALLAAAGAAVGCGARTQLVVVVDSDYLAAGVDVDRIELSVLGPAGQRVLDARVPLRGADAIALPATLGLVPAAAPPERGVTIVVRAMRDTVEVARREVHTGFVPGETRRVDAALSTSCIGASCPAGQTCAPGGCVDVETAAPMLPAWTGQAPAMDAGPPTQLAAGAQHACVVRARGDVVCWGANTFGQLGDGTMTAPARPVVVRGLPDAVAVSGGEQFTCAARRGGTVVCWGDAHGAQLGAAFNASTAPRCGSVGACWPSPFEIAGLGGAAEVALGGFYACARQPGGAMLCWGQNNHGNLGTGTLPPDPWVRPDAVTPLGQTAVAQIGAGQWHTCARATDGSVACWGWNRTGQLGPSVAVQPSDCASCGQASPVAVPGIADARDVAAGERYSCVVRAGGEVWCWGANGGGELGGTAVSAQSTPVRVPVAGGPYARVFAGSAHLCALADDGRLVCWGANDHGQLGDGASSAHAPDAPSTPLTDATTAALGRGFTCALRRQGAVACWGAAGSAGDGATSDRATPTMVALP